MSDYMGRCATCVHWGNSRAFTDDELNRLKSCDCPKFTYGYWDKEGEVPDDGGRIEDDEGWGMVTGPEFGCIHWKEKGK
jgi:hypothetical protein